MFFLVLRSETFNGKTCLILIELTANPAFDDFMLAIDAQQLGSECLFYVAPIAIDVSGQSRGQ